jgi:CrcB protein
VTPAPAPRLLVAVAVGGAVGAVARWAIGEAFGEASGFPWTTFGINVAGSFVLALLPAVAAVRRSRVLALGLGPGLLGGFTTLSTYAEQSRALLADGHDLMAASYVLGTLAVCLAAVAVAHRLSSPLAQREFEDEEGNE